MDIDLLDPPTSLEGIQQLTHTKTSFNVVLASQPTPFGALSLDQKFSATIEAVGWPADAFTTMLHSHDPTEVVTRTTEDGKTALHWAAAHLGEWLRMVSDIHDDSYFSRRTKSYAKLASDLVRMGANVHALWREQNPWLNSRGRFRRQDPFTTLFKGVDLETRSCWNRSSMARAVNLWGQVLVEGGVHLDNYIATEDEFLRTTDWYDLDIPSSGVYDGILAPARLFTSEQLTLAVEIREFPCVMIWKAQATPVPGAWPTTPLFVDTIIWSPGEMDECYGYRWVAADTVDSRTKPGSNKIDALSMSGGSDVLLYDSIIEAERRRSRKHVNQDDHGPVARVLGQEMRTHQQMSRRYNGRRASSVPPLHSRRAVSEPDWTNRKMFMPSGWCFTLHKCPLDLRWHKRQGYVDYSYFRRDCMQGRCHELCNSDE
jgi:hypothetical protein